MIYKTWNSWRCFYHIDLTFFCYRTFFMCFHPRSFFILTFILLLLLFRWEEKFTSKQSYFNKVLMIFFLFFLLLHSYFHAKANESFFLQKKNTQKKWKDILEKITTTTIKKVQNLCERTRNHKGICDERTRITAP